MARYNNSEIIHAIRNGEEGVLFYLSKKYFQSARRILRRRGLADPETPGVFSSVLLNVYRELQQISSSQNINFEGFFFSYLNDYLKENKNTFYSKSNTPEEKEISASCFTILDESSKKILAARYIEDLSFEEIAVRFSYSNPLIAEFEFNKAFNLFENVTRARLNSSIGKLA